MHRKLAWITTTLIIIIASALFAPFGSIVQAAGPGEGRFLARFWKRPTRTGAASRPAVAPSAHSAGGAASVGAYAVHRVFLDFHRTRLAALGLPACDAAMVNGHLVQYFAKGRLDWYPEHREGRRVVCHIGKTMPGADAKATAFARRGGATPIPTVTTTEISPAPLMRVSCAYSQTGRGGQQVVTVSLTTAEGDPLADIPVTLSVHEQGARRDLGTELTGPRGDVAFTFDIGAPASGTTALVDAAVTWGMETLHARASYRVWYPYP